MSFIPRGNQVLSGVGVGEQHSTVEVPLPEGRNSYLEQGRDKHILVVHSSLSIYLALSTRSLSLLRSAFLYMKKMLKSSTIASIYITLIIFHLHKLAYNFQIIDTQFNPKVHYY